MSNFHMAKYDAVAVLGRAVSPEGQLSQSDILRLGAAAKLYPLVTPLFIASGGGLLSLDNPKLAEARPMKANLVSRGIPPRVVHIEPYSLDTWGNALHTRQLIEQGPLRMLNIRRLGVLTSDFTEERATPIWDHAFGDDYEIEGIGVADPPTQRDLAGERSGIEVMKHVMATSVRGDVDTIWQSLAEIMPVYRQLKLAEAA